MKKIEITVGPSGATQVKTIGFSGVECRHASNFIEKALGTRVCEQLTSEFFADQTAQRLDLETS